MTIVSLSSSDGRFDVSVPADDAELIASMLLLLEVSGQSTVQSIERARTRVCSRTTPSREVHIVLAS